MTTAEKSLLAQEKIKTYPELVEKLQRLREKGKKIIQCHGVFDLLHPGHIKHFISAKQQGDILVVSLTPDRFVNKGPGRPAFNEQLRTESIAALDCVDYVILNDSPDAVTAIQRIQPHVYVKGKEYENPDKDITRKISLERAAVEQHQGTIFFTDDIVFSSSSLLNQFFDPLPKGVQKFLRKVKEKYTLDDLLQKIEKFQETKVLVIGDAIVDVYQYVDPLGQSGKGQHMAAVCKQAEAFLGGSLIVANHLAEFTPNVTLLAALGTQCPYQAFIQKKLNPTIQKAFILSKEEETLTKKRYVLQDGKSLTKLFETYSTNKNLLEKEGLNVFREKVIELSKQADCVVVCDFGNGFILPEIMEEISSLPNFLCVNTQINSGNRGYHVVTQYNRADYISLNEPEARLAVHDRFSDIQEIIQKLANKFSFSSLSITRGVNGVFSATSCSGQSVEIPALVTNAIDRIGAGDSFFAISSLSAYHKLPIELIGFLGSISAALDVQIVGNRESVKKTNFLKYLTRLMK